MNFISEQVMPAVVNVMKEEATLVTLVKPQFEARRSQVIPCFKIPDLSKTCAYMPYKHAFVTFSNDGHDKASPYYFNNIVKSF